MTEAMMPPINETHPTLIRLSKRSKTVVEVRCKEPGCGGNWRPTHNQFLKGGNGLRQHYMQGHPGVFRKTTSVKTIVKRCIHTHLTEEQVDGVNAGVDGAYLLEKIPVSGDRSKKPRREIHASLSAEANELNDADEGVGHILVERLRARNKAIDLCEMSDDEQPTNNLGAVDREQCRRRGVDKWAEDSDYEDED